MCCSYAKIYYLCIVVHSFRLIRFDGFIIIDTVEKLIVRETDRPKNNRAKKRSEPVLFTQSSLALSKFVTFNLE